MKKLLLAFMCACILLSGCGGREPETAAMQKFETQYFDVFDTVTALTVYAENQQQADSYTEAVHERLLELHRLFDPYNYYMDMDNLCSLNSAAGSERYVAVKNDLYNVIVRGIEAYDETDGAVNIAMGATLELWHQYRDDALENGLAAIPSEEQLEETRQYNDISAIELLVHDPASEFKLVRINKKGTSLNLGALAKGYAADEAIALLKEMGCDSALVNLGGNVACYKGSVKDSPWKIGVQDATDTEGMIDVVQTDNGFLISSGNYQRYYMYDGKKIHHIIDPDTLMPAEGMSGTTVVCGENTDCMTGDILSTALFIMPRESGDALAEKYGVEQVYYTDENGNVELLK